MLLRYRVTRVIKDSVSKEQVNSLLTGIPRPQKYKTNRSDLLGEWLTFHMSEWQFLGSGYKIKFCLQPTIKALRKWFIAQTVKVRLFKQMIQSASELRRNLHKNAIFSQEVYKGNPCHGQ